MRLSQEDFKSHCNELELRFELALKEIDELKKKLETYNKNSEILKKDQEIQELRYNNIVVLTKEAAEKHKSFMKKHKEKCYNEHGHYIYDVEFSPEETKVKIKCPICHEEINL